MPTPVTFIQIQAILRGSAEHLYRFAEEFASLPGDLWDAFPNPWAMVEVVASFSSGFAGRILAIPFAGFESMVRDYLKIAGLHNKLIRGDAALRWTFEGYTAFAQTITLTRDFGILVWLARTAAVWLYRTFRRLSFLWSVIGVANEVELANLFIQKFARRIGTLRITGLILGGFLVVAYAGATALFIGLAITCVDGSAKALFLPQDSARQRVRVRVIEKRVNRRRGPDT